MQKVLAIAHTAIMESLRRKDAYVVIILVALIVFGAGIFSRFGTEGVGKFVKDVAFSVTGGMAIMLCVIAAARQLPNEIQNRTAHSAECQTGSPLGPLPGPGGRCLRLHTKDRPVGSGCYLGMASTMW